MINTNKLSNAYLESLRDDFHQYFATKFPTESSKLLQAMHYSCSNGGKRIRPILVYLFADFLDIPHKLVNEVALSIELIHCYSIIHDDMPAMDDDDLRRGKPTLHLQYDEGTALLAGDTLQSLAFEVLADNNKITSDIIQKQILLLAKACGWQGMAGGQMLDLISSNKEITIEQLNTIHNLKTGALFSATLNMVAVLAPTKSKKIISLTEYIKNLGLAFQITDDILDVEINTTELGKPNNSDIKNNKSTYVSLLGLQQAKQIAMKHYDLTVNSIKDWPTKNVQLIWLANYLLHRKQ